MEKVRSHRMAAALAASALAIILLATALPVACEIDTTRPEVISYTPADGATEVKIDTVITVTFSEEIRETNLDSYITLRDDRGFTVPKQLSYSNRTYKVLVTPYEPLKYSTRYTVTVNAQIRDLAGNTLVMSETWAFTTVREKDPPMVVRTDPKGGEEGVATDANVTVTFNEEMDKESLETSLVIKDSSGQPVIGNTTPGEDGKTVGFDPLFSYAFGETYTVTVLKAVKDLAGNNMVNDYEFSFMVQFETIPPRVVGIEPIDKVGNVSLDAKIVVYFSEPMNSTSLSSTVVLQDADLNAIETTPFYHGQNYTLVVVPDLELEYQTVYHITVNTEAQDLAGNHIEYPSYSDFTTVKIPQAQPLVDSWSPGEDRFQWYESTKAKFNLEAHDPNDDVLVFTWYINGEVQSGNTQPEFFFFPEPGSAGSYKIEVAVDDGSTAPVKHFWIVDVIERGGDDGDDEEDQGHIIWGWVGLIILLAVLVSIFTIGYLRLMDRKREILARTRRRLRPLGLKRKVGPVKPPSYEEMYLRQDGVYGAKSPEFKPVAPPSDSTVKGAATKEATVDARALRSDAPQLLDAKEVEVRKAEVGPYATSAPELAKKRAPGAMVCPKCGRKAIEAAHGRVWCDSCGFVE